MRRLSTTMTERWWEAPTGLFSDVGVVANHAADPALVMVAGRMLRRAENEVVADVGGGGLTPGAARWAAVGEAVERWIVHPLDSDGLVEDSFQGWAHAESAIAPSSFVGFRPDQFEQPGFPYAPLTEATRCRWVRMRELRHGEPAWMPAEHVFLHPGSGRSARFMPTVSTGPSVGPTPDSALAGGLREVIERDAMVGAWWGR